MRRFLTVLLTLATFSVALFVTAALPSAPVGAVSSVEEVTANIVKRETLLPPADGFCWMRTDWWIVVDDGPDIAEITVVIRRVGTEEEIAVTFNRHIVTDIAVPEAAKFPAPGGKVHAWTGRNFTHLCENKPMENWEVVSAAAVKFTPPVPVPGAAAVEIITIPDGDRCTGHRFISVPAVPSAIEYDISYTRFGTEQNRTVQAGEFPSTALGTDVSYQKKGRNGVFVDTRTANSGGCVRLQYQFFEAGSGVITDVSFDVTTAGCFGRQPTIIAVPGQVTIGTNGPDVIIGTAGNDTIKGRGGNDRICAFGGGDVVRGGKGADRISGGNGDDLLFGNRGSDKIAGNKGIDNCTGGAGNDTITSCE